MKQDHTKNIQGIVLDWAGTIVDFGSLAPMGAFVELFARHQLVISIAEARVPMGLPKIDHIAALARMPAIAAQWQNLKGRPFSHSDAEELLTEFEPMSAQAALDRCTFIPGFMSAYHALKAQGLAFATTTGYTRTIMTPLIEIAHAQGFTPALVVCCDDVARSICSWHSWVLFWLKASGNRLRMSGPGQTKMRSACSHCPPVKTAPEMTSWTC